MLASCVYDVVIITSLLITAWVMIEISRNALKHFSFLCGKMKSVVIILSSVLVDLNSFVLSLLLEWCMYIHMMLGDVMLKAIKSTAGRFILAQLFALNGGTIGSILVTLSVVECVAVVLKRVATCTIATVQWLKKSFSFFVMNVLTPMLQWMNYISAQFCTFCFHAMTCTAGRCLVASFLATIIKDKGALSILISLAVVDCILFVLRHSIPPCVSLLVWVWDVVVKPFMKLIKDAALYASFAIKEYYPLVLAATKCTTGRCMLVLCLFVFAKGGVRDFLFLFAIVDCGQHVVKVLFNLLCICMVYTKFIIASVLDLICWIADKPIGRCFLTYLALVNLDYVAMTLYGRYCIDFSFWGYLQGTIYGTPPGCHGLLEVARESQRSIYTQASSAAICVSVNLAIDKVKTYPQQWK